MVLPTTYLVAAFAFFTGIALGAPVEHNLARRGEKVNHDSLNPIPTRVQDNIKGDLIKQFNPRLHIASGCQPYTAVDDDGNFSGGLQDSGSKTGGCRDTGKGQTYARMGQIDRATGTIPIMYAWYFPKDQTLDGISKGAHRHDWEAMVVWIDDFAFNANPQVRGGATSGHGGFTARKGALPGGDSPTVEYYSYFPTNHELQFTDTVGVAHEVLDYDAMPEAMQKALEHTDFGGALVPFKTIYETFEQNLAKALLPP